MVNSILLLSSALQLDRPTVTHDNHWEAGISTSDPTSWLQRRTNLISHSEQPGPDSNDFRERSYVDDPNEVYASDEETFPEVCNFRPLHAEAAISVCVPCESSNPGQNNLDSFEVSTRFLPSVTGGMFDVIRVLSIDPLLTSQVIVLLIQRCPALAADAAALQIAAYRELLHIHRLKMEAAANSQSIVQQTSFSGSAWPVQQSTADGADGSENSCIAGKTYLLRSVL
jgi:hypothetical protein